MERDPNAPAREERTIMRRDDTEVKELRARGLADGDG